MLDSATSWAGRPMRRDRAPAAVIVDPAALADWDEALGALPGAGFFHTAPWARVLMGAYGYRPSYVIIRSGQGLRGVLPLMEVDSWLTGRRGIGLPFSDECAPLAADDRSAQLLHAAALAHGRSRRWKHLEIRGGRARFGAVPASQSFLGHRLNLAGGEAKLFAGCESSTRRAVHRAEQSHLTVEFSRDLGAVRAFHELLCLTRQRHGVPPQPFSFFAQIQRHVMAPGHGWVALARHQGRPVAGAVFFHFGSAALYKYGASDAGYQHLRGNNLVMWAAIKRYAEDGFATLDFGRTARDAAGLRKFKLSWGCTEHPVEYVRQDLVSGAFAELRTETHASARWFRALPNPVLRLVGSLLYQHVA